MGIFDRPKTDGIMDEIRCDEPDYLIWKWRPAGSQKGPNGRENAVRWGSSLRVRDGSVAAFVCKQEDGTFEDFIEGPFDQILRTANLPVIADVVGMAYAGGTPFQAEVYFINLAHIVQTRFAVPFFDVFDPRFLDFGVPVAVRGTITFRIKDYRQFVKLHRLDEFDLDRFQRQVRDAVSRYAKAAVANAPSTLGIPVVQIERGLARIHDEIEPEVKDRLSRDFGVEVSGVDISAIEVDRTSEGYAKLMSVTRDVQSDTVRAQTDVNIRNLQDQQRINAQNLEETLRIQREEAQRAQRLTTETANFGVFRVEKQAEVGVAGANALGQMGANGASEIGSGSGGGFDPAAMMAGMAVGGALGQNIAGMVNGMMGGLADQQAQTPPPVPQPGYHVAVAGRATGPYGKRELGRMAASGAFGKDSLVWKQGMAEWRRAGDVAELAAVLEAGSGPAGMPPIPPTA